MTRLRDVWEGMSPRQKVAAVLIPLVITAFLLAGWIRSGQLYFETRKLEREANAAKRDATAALEKAAKIAREKLQMEKTLAEVEAKRDAKITEAEAAKINTLDARADYDRALREQRGDDPSTEQLCRELAALGYPCS